MSCGGRRGWIVRQRLLATRKLWRRPRLLTLTVDRKRFSSPVDAHRHVSRGKLVKELMRALGVKLWVWVLEFQQLTGDGWPHWHVLIDVAGLPGGRVDLKRAWALWLHKWGVGSVDLGKPGKRGFHKSNDPGHAVMYLTKYLTKQPDGGYPIWVLRSRRAIRFVQGCRQLGPLVDVPRKRAAREVTGARAGRSRLIERMATCDGRSHAWLKWKYLDESTGELVERVRYAGEISASPQQLVELSNARELARIPIISVEDDAGRASVIVLGRLQDLREDLAALGIDLAERQEIRKRARRRDIISTNKYAKRAAVTKTGHGQSAERPTPRAPRERVAGSGDPDEPGDSSPDSDDIPF